MPCPFSGSAHEAEHVPAPQLLKGDPPDDDPTIKETPFVEPGFTQPPSVPTGVPGVPQVPPGVNIERVLRDIGKEVKDDTNKTGVADVPSDEPFEDPLPLFPPILLPRQRKPGGTNVPKSGDKAPVVAKKKVARPSLVTALQSTAGQSLKAVFQAKAQQMATAKQTKPGMIPQRIAGFAEIGVAREIRRRINAVPKPGRTGVHPRAGVRTANPPAPVRALQRWRSGGFRATPLGALQGTGMRGGGGGGFLFNATARMNRLMGRIN